jgi:hypothetical protein
MTRFFSSLARHATGRLFWVNLGILIGLKLLVPFGSSQIATITSHVAGFDLDRAILSTNQERKAVQVPLLVRNVDLDRAAALKLDDMVAQGYFAHESPSGDHSWDFIRRAGYAYQAAGENLARGFSDPEAMVVAWMHSASHRANLLNPGYAHVGIAGRRVTIGDRTSYVVVLHLARPYGAAAAPRVSVPPSTPQPQVAAAVTVLPRADAPEELSTEPTIAAVTAPLEVTVRDDGAPRRTVSAVSAWYETYLLALLGALLLATGWIGFHRRLFVGWVAHAALLVALLNLPTLQRFITGTIY